MTAACRFQEPVDDATSAADWAPVTVTTRTARGASPPAGHFFTSVCIFKAVVTY